MTRVAACGGAELEATCALLGLTIETTAPRLVLVDLRWAGAASRAAAFASDVPRIFIATPDQAECLGAFGASGAIVAATAEPAVLGPLIARTLPRPARDRTRVVAVTAARGGSGRTLCAANLARRLAEASTVLAIDATGTGALGWWLGADPRPWSELEVLSDELGREHVELVASAVAPRLTLLGGAPLAPSLAVLGPAIAAAGDLADVVIVDGPLLADERGRACAARADRTLLLSYADAASMAALFAAEVPAEAWLLGSQDAISGAFRVLPRDERAIGEAITTRGPVGGALGRAYDDLAELIAIDAT